MAKTLTQRQEDILAFLKEVITERKVPPTVREIGEAVGLRSPSSVQKQLNTLERRGFIVRDINSPRSIRLVEEEELTPAIPSRRIPLVGQIAAGNPILADELVDEYYELPESFVGDGELFALTIRGDSMIDAGILNSDTVIVRSQKNVEQGDICAALIGDSATVKYFRREGNKLFLDPANDMYSPIELSPEQGEVSIMGRVVAVLRKM